jgi:hypothetical protein
MGIPPWKKAKGTAGSGTKTAGLFFRNKKTKPTDALLVFLPRQTKHTVRPGRRYLLAHSLSMFRVRQDYLRIFPTPFLYHV